MARKQVDWEAVELRFRAGTESLRSIAADFGITEGAIRQRAKKEDWSRDLSARVKAATEAALLRKAATHDVRTERQQVAVEAEMRSEVILRHRKDIGRTRGVFLGLLDEIEEIGPNGETLRDLLERVEAGSGDAIPKAKERLERMLSHSQRVDSAKRLTEILEKLIKLERQAFGIADEADPDQVANAAAAAAAGATAMMNGRALTDAERAIRLHRLLGSTPGALDVLQGAGE